MLKRTLEPEVMDSDEDASEYNRMDHSAVNQLFVSDLLSFAREIWLAKGAIGSAALPDYDDLTDDDFPLGDVLDMGTGTALIPVELCKRHPFCRVMAIDMAVSMLNLAVYNLEIAGLRDRIVLSQVDAKEMIFPDGMFDVGISNSIIHHLPEPIECVKEMVRVVRTGGIFFVRDLMRPADAQTVDRLVQQYAGQESGYSQQLFSDSLHAALSLDEIRSLVESLGFSPASVQATSDRHWTWAAIRE